MARNRFETLGDTLVERLVNLDGVGVEVGFDDRIHPGSGLPTNELARILLKGFGKQGEGRWIPARDYLTPFRDEIRMGQARLLKQAVQLTLKGKDASGPLEKLRTLAHETLSRVMDGFYDPENAPRTIRKKGRDDPLNDRGDLIDSIVARVIHAAATPRSRRPR